jgi:hypothetical protein
VKGRGRIRVGDGVGVISIENTYTGLRGAREDGSGGLDPLKSAYISCIPHRMPKDVKGRERTPEDPGGWPNFRALPWLMVDPISILTTT